MIIAEHNTNQRQPNGNNNQTSSNTGYNKQEAVDESTKKLKHYQELHKEFMNMIDAGDSDYDDEENADESKRARNG